MVWDLVELGQKWMIASFSIAIMVYWNQWMEEKMELEIEVEVEVEELKK